MNATCTITWLSARVNAVLQFGDPEHYTEAICLCEKLKANITSYNNFAMEDLLIYEGHEILYNRTSTLHTDSSDPQNGWAILTAFGTFKGGYIWLPNLGLYIRLEPGDTITLWGWVIPHEVEAWDGGQHISIPHFTHSVWRSMGFTSVFTFWFTPRILLITSPLATVI